MVGVYKMKFFMSGLKTRIWKGYGEFDLSKSNSTPTVQYFHEFDLSMKKRIEMINGYDNFVQSKVNEGWFAYLTTFMFSPLSGPHSSKLDQMKREPVPQICTVR